MPEYEYRCKKCERTFAIERSMSDSSPVNCSYCQSNDLARIWGVNFLTASNSAKSESKSTAAAQGGTCDTNPSQPKSCCPCS